MNHSSDDSGLWSCDPADIQPWTEQDMLLLHAALAKIFNWNGDQSNDKEPE